MEIKNYGLHTPTLSNIDLKQGAGTHRDRDSQQGGGQRQREPEKNPYLTRDLTDEELVKALECLKNLTGYRDAGLTAKVEKNAQGKRIVLIVDSNQNVVRRLTDADLGTAFLLPDSDDTAEKGRLLNKSV